MKFEEQTDFYKKEIEHALREWMGQYQNLPQSQLYDAMSYSLLGGGKRLRPIFALEFCRLCCGDYRKAIPFAVGIEMIQTYSLIHDDLPAMDNDDLRRGKPTNHKVYGEALAILAGDALLTDAFLAVSSAELPAVNIASAISVLAEYAGSKGMVGGQVLDILSEERTLTEQEVLNVQSRKTGALIHASCVLGVIAGDGSKEQMEAAAGFATCLGLAFQIRDDMLDVIGSQDVLGKGTGTDEKKNTFVRLYGLDVCETMVRTYTQKAIDFLSCFENAQYLRELASSLLERIQ